MFRFVSFRFVSFRFVDYQLFRFVSSNTISPKEPLASQTVHVDFTGPFMNTMNKMFMVVVDSHSKWLKVEIMPNVTSETTVEKLRDLFVRFGIPER